MVGRCPTQLALAAAHARWQAPARPPPLPSPPALLPLCFFDLTGGRLYSHQRAHVGMDSTHPPTHPPQALPSSLHCTPLRQVDARALTRELMRLHFGAVLATGEACMLPLGGRRLLLRVTGCNTLDAEAQEEELAYHCFRGEPGGVVGFWTLGWVEGILDAGAEEERLAYHCFRSEHPAECVSGQMGRLTGKQLAHCWVVAAHSPI